MTALRSRQKERRLHLLNTVDLPSRKADKLQIDPPANMVDFSRTDRQADLPTSKVGFQADKQFTAKQLRQTDTDVRTELQVI